MTLQLALLETDLAGAGDAGGGGAADQAAAVADAPAGDPGGLAADVAAGQTGGWAPDQHEWQQMQEAIGQWQQVLAEAQQAANQPGEPPDVYADPEGYAQYLQELQQHSLQQQLAPLQPLIEQAQAQQAQQWVDQQFTQLEQDPALAGFDRDATLYAAAGFQRQGYDPQTALRQAAMFTRQRDKQVADKAVEAYKASLTQSQATRPDLAGGTAGVPGEPPPRSYREIAERYIETAAAGNGGNDW